MNILHVVNISFVIPFFLGKQLNWFTNKGHQEYIVCSPSDELEKLSQQYNFQYKPIEVLRKISIVKDLKAVYGTFCYIRQIKANVVTGHTPKGGLIAMLAAYFARVPIRIYFRHGLVYETSIGIKRSLLMNMDRLASRLATKIVCVSRSVAHRSLEDSLNPEYKQIILANGTCNGTDVERFCKEKIDVDSLMIFKKNLGINDDDFVIGFTGRLVRDKGVVELVKAYQKLKEKYLNIRLMLVGMLEMRDALSDDVVKTIIEDKGIIYTGYVANSTIEQYYALMDVFVLPSYREGFPTSVLEASAMEIPVITTRVTGCCDSILEGETGIFVNHEADQIEDAVIRLYSNQSLRKHMGERGREFVMSYFRQELIWNEIEKLYAN